MKPAFILLFLLVLCLPASCRKPAEPLPVKTPPEARKEEQQYKKEMDEIRKAMKGDLRIKLKRDGKADSYSWEITGKDTAEVLRANDVLVKKLGE
jgi:hypothetical protein